MVSYQIWNIKAKVKVFAQNRHDRLVGKRKTRYPQTPFQEYEIDKNSLDGSCITLKLLKLLADVYVLF